MDGLDLRVGLRQTQKLLMTPVLQQAIKLLQLSKLDLQELVQQEVETNPVLEEVSASSEASPGNGQDNGSLSHEAESPEIKIGDYPDSFDWKAFFNDESESSFKREYQGSNGEEQNFSWESILTSLPSLGDHLIWQLRLSNITDQEFAVGEQLIHNIDENGYLKATLAELAEMVGTDCCEVEKMLGIIKTFDPAGVGAGNLKECLLLQLDKEEDKDLLRAVINNHLSDLETRKYKSLARKLKVSEDKTRLLCDSIRRLDPKPGLKYSSEYSFYVIPDVYVYKLDNEYIISVNDEGIPRLRISNLYKKLLQSGDPGKGVTKNYIEEKMRSALWLIKNINQRQSTLYRVTKSIVNHQRDFFDHGIDFLKPLTLREIADNIGMHESTISRVTSNKYMHSPRGTFELKYFFHSGLETAAGVSISSLRIKEEIKKLIRNEDSRKPLTDDHICEKLNERGVTIARRTVTKYR
ncbi:MAG: RNA polymerase factor sigma-54, partial [bacterium]